MAFFGMHAKTYGMWLIYVNHIASITINDILSPVCREIEEINRRATEPRLLSNPPRPPRRPLSAQLHPTYHTDLVDDTDPAHGQPTPTSDPSRGPDAPRPHSARRRAYLIKRPHSAPVYGRITPVSPRSADVSGARGEGGSVAGGDVGTQEVTGTVSSSDGEGRTTEQKRSETPQLQVITPVPTPEDVDVVSGGSRTVEDREVVSQEVTRTGSVREEDIGGTEQKRREASASPHRKVIRRPHSANRTFQGAHREAKKTAEAEVGDCDVNNESASSSVNAAGDSAHLSPVRVVENDSESKIPVHDLPVFDHTVNKTADRKPEFHSDEEPPDTHVGYEVKVQVNENSRRTESQPLSIGQPHHCVIDTLQLNDPTVVNKENRDAADVELPEPVGEIPDQSVTQANPENFDDLPCDDVGVVSDRILPISENPQSFVDSVPDDLAAADPSLPGEAAEGSDLVRETNHRSGRSDTDSTSVSEHSEKDDGFSKRTETTSDCVRGSGVRVTASSTSSGTLHDSFNYPSLPRKQSDFLKEHSSAESTPQAVPTLPHSQFQEASASCSGQPQQSAASGQHRTLPPPQHKPLTNLQAGRLTFGSVDSLLVGLDAEASPSAKKSKNKKSRFKSWFSSKKGKYLPGSEPVPVIEVALDAPKTHSSPRVSEATKGRSSSTTQLDNAEAWTVASTKQTTKTDRRNPTQQKTVVEEASAYQTPFKTNNMDRSAAKPASISSKADGHSETSQTGSGSKTSVDSTDKSAELSDTHSTSSEGGASTGSGKTFSLLSSEVLRGHSTGAYENTSVNFNSNVTRHDIITIQGEPLSTYDRSLLLNDSGIPEELSSTFQAKPVMVRERKVSSSSSQEHQTFTTLTRQTSDSSSSLSVVELDPDGSVKLSPRQGDFELFSKASRLVQSQESDDLLKADDEHELVVIREYVFAAKKTSGEAGSPRVDTSSEVKTESSIVLHASLQSAMGGDVGGHLSSVKEDDSGLDSPPSIQDSLVPPVKPKRKGSADARAEGTQSLRPKPEDTIMESSTSNELEHTVIVDSTSKPAHSVTIKSGETEDRADISAIPPRPEAFVNSLFNQQSGGLVAASVAGADFSASKETVYKPGQGRGEVGALSQSGHLSDTQAPHNGDVPKAIDRVAASVSGLSASALTTTSPERQKTVSFSLETEEKPDPVLIPADFSASCTEASHVDLEKSPSDDLLDTSAAGAVYAVPDKKRKGHGLSCDTIVNTEAGKSESHLLCREAVPAVHAAPPRANASAPGHSHLSTEDPVKEEMTISSAAAVQHAPVMRHPEKSEDKGREEEAGSSDSKSSPAKPADRQSRYRDSLTEEEYNKPWGSDFSSIEDDIRSKITSAFPPTQEEDEQESGRDSADAGPVKKHSTSSLHSSPKLPENHGSDVQNSDITSTQKPGGPPESGLPVGKPYLGAAAVYADLQYNEDGAKAAEAVATHPAPSPALTPVSTPRKISDRTGRPPLPSPPSPPDVKPASKEEGKPNEKEKPPKHVPDEKSSPSHPRKLKEKFMKVFSHSSEDKKAHKGEHKKGTPTLQRKEAASLTTGDETAANVEKKDEEKDSSTTPPEQKGTPAATRSAESSEVNEKHAQENDYMVPELKKQESAINHDDSQSSTAEQSNNLSVTNEEVKLPYSPKEAKKIIKAEKKNIAKTQTEDSKDGSSAEDPKVSSPKAPNRALKWIKKKLATKGKKTPKSKKYSISGTADEEDDDAAADAEAKSPRGSDASDDSHDSGESSSDSDHEEEHEHDKPKSKHKLQFWKGKGNKKKTAEPESDSDSSAEESRLKLFSWSLGRKKADSSDYEDTLPASYKKTAGDEPEGVSGTFRKISDDPPQTQKEPKGQQDKGNEANEGETEKDQTTDPPTLKSSQDSPLLSKPSIVIDSSATLPAVISDAKDGLVSAEKAPSLQTDPKASREKESHSEAVTASAAPKLFTIGDSGEPESKRRDTGDYAKLRRDATVDKTQTGSPKLPQSSGYELARPLFLEQDDDDINSAASSHVTGKAETVVEQMIVAERNARTLHQVFSSLEKIPQEEQADEDKNGEKDTKTPSAKQLPSPEVRRKPAVRFKPAIQAKPKAGKQDAPRDPAVEDTIVPSRAEQDFRGHSLNRKSDLNPKPAIKPRPSAVTKPVDQSDPTPDTGAGHDAEQPSDGKEPKPLSDLVLGVQASTTVADSPRSNADSDDCAGRTYLDGPGFLDTAKASWGLQNGKPDTVTKPTAGRPDEEMQETAASALEQKVPVAGASSRSQRPGLDEAAVSVVNEQDNKKPDLISNKPRHVALNAGHAGQVSSSPDSTAIENKTIPEITAYPQETGGLNTPGHTKPLQGRGDSIRKDESAIDWLDSRTQGKPNAPKVQESKSPVKGQKKPDVLAPKPNIRPKLFAKPKGPKPKESSDNCEPETARKPTEKKAVLKEDVIVPSDSASVQTESSPVLQKDNRGVKKPLPAAKPTPPSKPAKPVQNDPGNKGAEIKVKYPEVKSPEPKPRTSLKSVIDDSCTEEWNSSQNVESPLHTDKPGEGLTEERVETPKSEQKNVSFDSEVENAGTTDRREREMSSSCFEESHNSAFTGTSTSSWLEEDSESSPGPSVGDFTLSLNAHIERTERKLPPQAKPSLTRSASSREEDTDLSLTDHTSLTEATSEDELTTVTPLQSSHADDRPTPISRPKPLSKSTPLSSDVSSIPPSSGDVDLTSVSTIPDSSNADDTETLKLPDTTMSDDSKIYEQIFFDNISDPSVSKRPTEAPPVRPEKRRKRQQKDIPVIVHPDFDDDSDNMYDVPPSRKTFEFPKESTLPVISIVDKRGSKTSLKQTMSLEPEDSIQPYATCHRAPGILKQDSDYGDDENPYLNDDEDFHLISRSLNSPRDETGHHHDDGEAVHASFKELFPEAAKKDEEPVVEESDFKDVPNILGKEPNDLSHSEPEQSDRQRSRMEPSESVSSDYSAEADSASQSDGKETDVAKSDETQTDAKLVQSPKKAKESPHDDDNDADGKISDRPDAEDGKVSDKSDGHVDDNDQYLKSPEYKKSVDAIDKLYAALEEEEKEMEKQSSQKSPDSSKQPAKTSVVRLLSFEEQRAELKPLKQKPEDRPPLQEQKPEEPPKSKEKKESKKKKLGSKTESKTTTKVSVTHTASVESVVLPSHSSCVESSPSVQTSTDDSHRPAKEPEKQPDKDHNDSGKSRASPKSHKLPSLAGFSKFVEKVVHKNGDSKAKVKASEESRGGDGDTADGKHDTEASGKEDDGKLLTQRFL